MHYNPLLYTNNAASTSLTSTVPFSLGPVCGRLGGCNGYHSPFENINWEDIGPASAQPKKAFSLLTEPTCARLGGCVGYHSPFENINLEDIGSPPLAHQDGFFGTGN
ncbi:MAG: hypothetical protein RLZ12_294 [Bacillota bacterium]|jgi:hypothetical protein